MNKEPSKPKSTTARRHDVATHPVLARLPDVTGQPSPPPRPDRAAAAGFVDYRFDLPEGDEAAPTHSRQRVHPPAYKKSPPSQRRSRPFGGPSRALPGSNPFAIPATSMLDRLVPVARFLMLFVLFTAIGTLVLSTMRERSGDPAREQPPSAAAPAAVELKLEPAPNVDHPTIASPKAYGPLGANSSQAVIESSPLVEINPPTEASSSRTEAELLPSLGGANGEPLPQVQTTDVATSSSELVIETAPARLIGEIRPSEESPKKSVYQNLPLPPGPRSAVAGEGHAADSKQLKKPPAVARLPAIFEAPRHAYQ